MIEVAEFDDIKEIIKLSLNIPKEHGFEKLPEVDLNKVCKFFYTRFERAPIFVYRKEDKIVGFVGVQVEEFWWSRDKVVNDYIFYIHPDHRNIKVLNSLLEALKDFAEVNKLPVVSNFMSNDRTETKEKMFERKGFKKAGFIATLGV